MLVDVLHVISQLLLPSQTDLHLDRVVADEQSHTLILEVTSTQEAPACPNCATAAPRVHSHYPRTLADLPWADVAVRVQLHVRKCFCLTATCPRTIFCERVPLVAPLGAAHDAAGGAAAPDWGRRGRGGGRAPGCGA